MQRLLRLSEFWNWIPAFRAVAECAHLPTAARALHVSPSALSRSIGLLERSLGQPLFKRVGRRIELNPAGLRFLAAVRDGMRLMDDGLSAVTAAGRLGPLNLSTVGLLSHAVLPALRELQAERPDLVLHLYNHPAYVVNDLLLRGSLDAAFLPGPQLHDLLHVERIGSATNGVYCGRGHPLFRARRITLDGVLTHPFAAPIPGERGLLTDGWPVDVPRRVKVYLSQLHVALEMCASGHLLAVLPDRLAAMSPRRSALRRLPVDLVPPTAFYAVRRPSLSPGGLAELAVATVKRNLRGLA